MITVLLMVDPNPSFLFKYGNCIGFSVVRTPGSCVLHGSRIKLLGTDDQFLYSLSFTFIVLSLKVSTSNHVFENLYLSPELRFIGSLTSFCLCHRCGRGTMAGCFQRLH